MLTGIEVASVVLPSRPSNEVTKPTCPHVKFSERNILELEDAWSCAAVAFARRILCQASSVPPVYLTMSNNDADSVTMACDAEAPSRETVSETALKVAPAKTRVLRDPLPLEPEGMSGTDLDVQ